MDKMSLEERRYLEWGLTTAEKIKNKIFENYSDNRVTIKNMLDAEKLVACGYALGKILTGDEVRLKAFQLREFYESLLNVKITIKSIRGNPDEDMLFKQKALPEIVMLKPRLALAKARQPRKITPLFEVINPLLDRVEDIDDYERLCQFMQAIMAYNSPQGQEA
uniref:CRISPR system Cms protein Csm2 n=2 Tax=viral metagenome TaxID=1070528 RepID=A0A6M3IXD8_9ZZZZ